MKLNKIVLYTLLIFLVIGCAKDKGNYTYSNVRKISVKNVGSISMVASKELIINPSIYVINGNDTIERIIPPIEGEKINNDTYKPNDNLSFYWEIGGEKVSEEINLKRIIEGSGELFCRYVVIDNVTGIRYYYPFNIKLTSPFAAGYFALAKAEDSRSILTFKSTREADEKEPIITVDNINGKYFGTNPIYLGIKRTGSASNPINYDLYISSENDGNGTVFITDLLTFEYKGVMDKESVAGVEDDADYRFRWEASNEYFFIASGKVHLPSRNMLFRAAAPNVDYYLAPWIGTAGYFVNTCFVAFDNKNSRFLHFAKDESRPSEGYIADVNALDRAVQVNISVNGIEDLTITKGQHFIGGGAYGDEPTINAITSDNHKFYFYTIMMDLSTYPFYFPYKAEFAGAVEIPGINENSCAKLNTTSREWTIAVGNKLYRTTSNIVNEYKEVFTLPEKSGDIVTMEFISKLIEEEVMNDKTGQMELVTNRKSCALVATYNPQATGDLKGSIYVVNLTDNTLLESYPNCTGKAVSVFFSLMQ